MVPNPIGRALQHTTHGTGSGLAGAIVKPQPPPLPCVVPEAAPPGTVRWASRKQARRPRPSRPRGMGSRLRCPKADPARNRTSPPHSIAGGGLPSLGVIFSQNQQAGRQSREWRACHASGVHLHRHTAAAATGLMATGLAAVMVAVVAATPCAWLWS